MDERDPPALRAGARRFVYQVVAPGAATCEGRLEVGHSNANMVDAWPAFPEESGDRAVCGIGGQQLDVDVPEADGNNSRPIRCFRMGRFEAQYVTVEGGGFLEVDNGDTDMGNSGMGFGHRTSE
jgi:hypothetical protein